MFPTAPLPVAPPRPPPEVHGSPGPSWPFASPFVMQPTGRSNATTAIVILVLLTIGFLGFTAWLAVSC